MDGLFRCVFLSFVFSMEFVFGCTWNYKSSTWLSAVSERTKASSSDFYTSSVSSYKGGQWEIKDVRGNCKTDLWCNWISFGPLHRLNISFFNTKACYLSRSRFSAVSMVDAAIFSLACSFNVSLLLASKLSTQVHEVWWLSIL